MAVSLKLFDLQSRAIPHFKAKNKLFWPLLMFFNSRIDKIWVMEQNRCPIFFYPDFTYRDSHIFSDTLYKFFMVNWFTWPWSLLNTKFTLILYPHILKISLRLSNYGSRYSLVDNQRSNSEITHPHFLVSWEKRLTHPVF